MIYALIALVAIITAVLVVIRTNTAVVFLAICAGTVLASAAGKDTDLVAHSFASGDGVSSNAVQATLVLLPGVVSAILLIKRIPKHKIFLGVIPAFCSAIVGLTLVYPFLTGSFQSTLRASKGWSLIVNNYELIVIVGVLTSLITIALTLPKSHKNEKHKKKH